MEKLTFAEFISLCDVSHWETINSVPDPIISKGDYAVVEVVPANDPDFRIRGDLPVPEGTVVDWGEPVVIVDSPYQHAYTIFHRIEEGRWKCQGSLYATLREAREALEDLFTNLV